MYNVSNGQSAFEELDEIFYIVQPKSIFQTHSDLSFLTYFSKYVFLLDIFSHTYQSRR